MRSWVKDPEILDDIKDFELVSLFKSMVYDYMFANLDPIEKSTITYILVNWREMKLTSSVRDDMEDIVNKFLEYNSLEITNDVLNAITNAEMIQERIEYLTRLG